MAKFTVNLSKTIGTVTATETAAIVVNADNAAAASRLALEQLADDASEIQWKTVEPANVVTPNATTTAHITSVVADK